MTENDKILIEKALTSGDYQEVDKLVEKVESAEAQQRIRMHSNYLYLKEKSFGVAARLLPKT
jgi:hypothetical protein